MKMAPGKADWPHALADATSAEKMGRSLEKALGLVLAVLGGPILGLLLATAGLPVLPSTLIALVAGFWFYLAWEKAQ
jgi:hypothetical protein